MTSEVDVLMLTKSPVAGVKRVIGSAGVRCEGLVRGEESFLNERPGFSSLGLDHQHST